MNRKLRHRVMLQILRVDLAICSDRSGSQDGVVHVNAMTGVPFLVERRGGVNNGLVDWHGIESSQQRKGGVRLSRPHEEYDFGPLRYADTELGVSFFGQSPEQITCPLLTPLMPNQNVAVDVQSHATWRGAERKYA